ncbi:hypothetical protein QTJ16_000259 [Diplocarpon rosae]|uniref:Uncharacterized protein n=1 Tax=Diplocarpon rosae TaxID=946125 RepID=A0AAD9T6F2_9HELO|nr:hypothetical protein QTJ16_000259 [Diplocarpon rosae]
MPSLSINTSPTKAAYPDGNSPESVLKSRSASPVRPPVSPITPTLKAAQPLQHVRQMYTHSQPSQIAVPLPPPEPIKFDENPDVLATKSAISILMMQARIAQDDIKSLQRTKERGLQDPEEFLRALQAGEIKQKGDTLMGLAQDDDEDDEDADSTKLEAMKDHKSWERLPKAQNVVHMPHINWDQYAVVGDSLDKLHADQLRHPPEGSPDGQILAIGLSPAPATPAKDKIERMGTRKGGKR